LLTAAFGPEENLPIWWQVCRLSGGQRTKILEPTELLETSKMTHSGSGVCVAAMPDRFAKAAPIMLGLAAPQSPSETQHAFDEFFVWGLYARGTTIVLTFIAVTWALADPGRRRNN
jgi:hypothetical protein